MEYKVILGGGGESSWKVKRAKRAEKIGEKRFGKLYAFPFEIYTKETEWIRFVYEVAERSLSTLEIRRWMF